MPLPYETLTFDSSKTYAICTINRKTGVNILKYVTSKQAEILISSMKIIAKYDYFENKIEEVTINYSEFVNFLSKKENPDERNNKTYIQINRLFLNFLNSWRIFIEFTDASFNRYFDKKSIEYVSYKKFTGGLFDNEFTYKFFCKLRNYSEHEGYPIYVIKVDNDGNKEAFFDKQMLSPDYFPKKHFEQDLKKFYSYFPVLPQCEKGMELLQCTFNYFKGTHKKTFDDCVQNIINCMGDLFDFKTEYYLAELHIKNEESRFQRIKNETIKSIKG